MGLWLFRAGSAGEYENKFLDDRKVYLTWDNLDVDLRGFNDKKELYDYLINDYGVNKKRRAINWGTQIWPIANDMGIGDWVILPSKLKSSIHIGKIISDYVFDIENGSPYYHYREVDWFATDIPRSNFDQDILYSLGAFLTVCRIRRNNAEKRIKQMADNNWISTNPNTDLDIDLDDNGTLDSEVDLEQYANDSIAKYLIRKFKGHGMARIIESILQAKGYSTYRSPEGPDKGVDILASQGPLGFESPRLCVQVKTSDTPVDRPTLDQLIGTMNNFNADHGLLVSWGGFKTSIDKEIPNQYFKVRLWDQKSIILELLANYDKLNEDIKAEIPLKRIWTIAMPDDD